MEDTVDHRRKAAGGELRSARKIPAGIPDYLEEHYHWAYLDPFNARLLDRRLVTEVILWGNYRRLCNRVLDELPQGGTSDVLQVACAYGDLTPRIGRHLGSASRLDVVDVSTLQIGLARSKTRDLPNVRLEVQNSASLAAADASYDRVVLFFLLHEMPDDVRRRTLAEALRVCRPGGKVVIADYHGPHRLNPLRYLMQPLLARLEPFALDLWRHDLASMAPAGTVVARHQTLFGGLYQFAVIDR